MRSLGEGRSLLDGFVRFAGLREKLGRYNNWAGC